MTGNRNLDGQVVRMSLTTARYIFEQTTILIRRYFGNDSDTMVGARLLQSLRSATSGLENVGDRVGTDEVTGGIDNDWIVGAFNILRLLNGILQHEIASIDDPEYENIDPVREGLRP